MTNLFARQHRTPLLNLSVALVLALGVLWVLSGCGFAPRQTTALPFATMALRGLPFHAPMHEELRYRVNSSRGTRVTDETAQAKAILEVVSDSLERTRGAFTLAGQIRSIDLTYRFQFRVLNGTGQELIPLTELSVARSMAYNESQALGKEKEEVTVVRSMQAEIANQVMRRLAAVSPS